MEMFVLEPGKLGYDYWAIHVVAWRNSGEICVRAWKSIVNSRGHSRGSLETYRGNLCSSLEK